MINHDFNKVILTGRCRFRPVLCHTVNGTPVTNFILESQTRNGMERFDMTCWGELAEKAAIGITDNEKLICEGCLHTRYMKKDNCDERRYEIALKRIFSINEEGEEYEI